MSFNPFDQKPIKFDKVYDDWKKLYPKSYDKNTVDPYTKLRIILMNGTEYEAVWHSHSFSRHCDNNDARREIALVRRNEQQQQKTISCLKPIDEPLLETTIGYEHLAVDLTAILAAREPNKYVKQALDFALLEDFDHLYRYADLLEMESGVRAERLIGGYAEIMPGRPTISEHRYPYEDIKRHIDSKTADPITKLNVAIITAAEQQTMNYYMNIASFYSSDIGRQLYAEIAMIEEQHVSHYGSLLDTNCTWFEGNLMHEYVECYLYYSCFMDETDANVKKVWENCLMQEIAHLHKAAELLKKFEKKDWQMVIPNGAFPELLTFHPTKDYVRQVLKNTTNITSMREDYAKVKDLPETFDFFRYQNIVNKNTKDVPSHAVIDKYIKKKGKDYRFEESPHPVKNLRDGTADNTDVGRSVELTENAVAL
ncbi:MAG: hypothetical protein EOM87_06415 [Clostridia bacterium]|nr:hypothetical protein [Clostridia bacterium]